MKKIRGFFVRKTKKEQQSSSRSGASTSASPLGADGGDGYELWNKDLSKLHRAAAEGDLETFQQQLKKHNMNQLDKANRTPLHLACANGCTDIVNFLVGSKCRLNLCDKDNRSPLMKAVQCQQEVCAVYLLQHGADPNLVDVNGNTALHLAAMHSNIYIAERLLENNAQIDAQNKEGSTPLALAIAENNQEMAEYLIKKGASVYTRDHAGSSQKNAEEFSPVSKKSLSALSSPNKVGDKGFTLGAPAMNKEEVDYISSGESARDFGKTSDDSWLSSEEEVFSPKKPQEPKLAQLRTISQKFRKMNNKNEIGKNPLPKESFKVGAQNTIYANKERRKDLNYSSASDEEEVELEYEEEEEEEEDDDDNMEDDLSQKEDENTEESQGEIENKRGKCSEKSKKRGRLSEIFVDNKPEWEGNHADRNVSGSSKGICSLQGEEMQKSDKIPVSFITGHFAYSEENKDFNKIKNDLPNHSSKKEKSNNAYEEVDQVPSTREQLQSAERNRKIEHISQKGFLKNMVCSSDTFELTSLTKAELSSVLNSHNNKPRNLGKSLESDGDPWSETELEKHKTRRQDSKNPDFVDNLKTGEKDYRDSRELKKAMGEQYVQKCENSEEENLKEAFQPNSKEVSSEEGDGGNRDEVQNGNVLDKNLTSASSSQNQKTSDGGKREITALRMNKEDSDASSAWDSEQKANKANLKYDVTHLFKERETSESKKSDLMEELGLDEADDIEDVSDWDSDSFSLKNIPSIKHFNALMLGNEASPLQPAIKKSEIIPLRAKELPSVQTIIASEGGQFNKTKGNKENKGVNQEKGIIDTAMLIEQSSLEHQTGKIEVSLPCNTKKTEAVTYNEESNNDCSQFDSTLWEERYEKMWVANEKREVKSHFKSITAELKQMFGEINVNEKVSNISVDGKSHDGSSDVLESINVSLPPHLCKATRGVRGKNDFGDLSPALAEEQFSDQNPIPFPLSSSSQELHFKQHANMKQNWNGNSELLCTTTECTKVNISEEKRDSTSKQSEANVCGKTTVTEKCPVYLAKHSCQDIISDKTTCVRRPVTTDNTNLLFAVARSPAKKPPCHFHSGIFRDYAVSNYKDIEFKIENDIESSDLSCHPTSNKELNDELERDVSRFKHEVGMLKVAFLALEKEKALLQNEAEEERKRKWEELGIEQKGKEEDTEKKMAVNTLNQKTEQMLPVQENQKIKTERKPAKESRVKTLISVEGNELIPIPLKGGKDIRESEDKRWTSKETSSKQTIENPHQVEDESSLSEASLQEERETNKTMNGKNKIGRAMDITNDSDDITQSSDTAAEDSDLPTSICREAMMLLERLTLDCKDAAGLQNIKNIIHGYEQLIENEKERHALFLEKVKKVENEKEDLQRILEAMREAKSILEHQNIEREKNMSSLKVSLKQEEEKRISAEVRCEKNHEQLRRKEEQYSKEMMEKQDLELMLRSLEMELKMLENRLKQAEEERDETQQQLSQEQNARTLQEGLLNTIKRQRDLEEESQKTMNKSSKIDAEGKDPSHKNQILQDELAVIKLELDQLKVQHREEEVKHLKEKEALKEKVEELKKEFRLNKEALTQTVFQYDEQINVSKSELMKENNESLEAELDSFRSRLSSAVQDLERCQISNTELEHTLQRERDEWLQSKDKLNQDLSNLREANNCMSLQLSQAESKANGIENELHHVSYTLREKNLLIESVQRELCQAQGQIKELENARQAEKDQMNKHVVKQESMQERLAQLQSENLLLRQQFEDFQNKGIIQERVVSDVQNRFSEIFNQLRADAKKEVEMVEEKNKEITAKCNHLKDQVSKYKKEKVEREAALRQLEQELVDSLKKQTMSEAALEVTSYCRRELEEENQHLQKEKDLIKCKLQESEEQHVQSGRHIHDLRTALDVKEREANMASQQLQELTVASTGTNNSIQLLEEHVQRLEVENSRLEGITKQQTGRIEKLQEDLQKGASDQIRLEELITSLQEEKISLEEQLNQQMQKQNMLSESAQGTQNMWEEELKSKSKLGIRLSELDREKAELMIQLENEKKKVKKLIELKRSVETRLDQEMKRNSELQKDCIRFKRLLKTTKQKIKESEHGESSSHTSFHGEKTPRYSKTDAEVEKLRVKLEAESTRCTQLESTNRDLRESMMILCKNHETLEKSRLQLEEEIATLKHEGKNITEHSQIEQYKRDIEERARQEIRQTLEEVNLFLQRQAASQENLEQLRATNTGSLKNRLEQRIQNLEFELARLKNNQQDNFFEKESTHSELERYKGLYSEELKMRESLGKQLDRTNEKLAEANTKLLHERQKSTSLLANSFVSGNLSVSPVMETIQLGNLSSNLALNRTLSLGGGFVNLPGGNTLSSKNRVEAYLAKMQLELEKISPRN